MTYAFTAKLIETEDGEYAVIFPNEILEESGLKAGDVVEYKIRKLANSL